MTVLIHLLKTIGWQQDVIDAYKAEFKEIADYFNISQVSEGKNISNLYDKWGMEY